jgi:hypothetical protein
MKNDIQICDKCRHIRVKTLLPKLQKLDPHCHIKIGCKSYCGPCARGPFVFVNGRYLTGQSEDELLEKTGRYVRSPRPRKD